MDITVILCTFNRCTSLAKALHSVAASRLPESVQWEVLIVDNNSSDQTRAVVDEICCRYPGRFRYLFEARQGKSHALNTAVQEALGDVLAFMDDDVTVESTWLEKLSSSLHDSKWAGVGGRILPEEAFAPPRWLSTESRYALAPFAIFDLGPEAAELAEPPFGTNMAFRKGMFVKYGDFRTDIGPCPGSEIRGEDTEFGSRLLAGGERLWYEPSAIVYHSISQHRVQKKYLLEWWFDKGRSETRAFGIPPEARWLVGGVPLFLFRRLALWGLRWVVAVEPSRRFSNRLSTWGVAGRILECYRRSRNVSLKQPHEHVVVHE